MTQPLRLSYTRAKELLACPHRYRRINVAGEVEPKGELASMGTMGHRIAEEYGRRLSRMGRERASTMFYEIAADHTALLSYDELDALNPALDNFVDYFKLDTRSEENRFEYELAITRDGAPLDYADALKPDGTARVDCFTGIIDYVAFMDGHSKAILKDWKFGFIDFDFNELVVPSIVDGQVRGNLQMAGYAYMLFVHNPELEAVAPTLYAPRFRRWADGAYEREALMTAMKEIQDDMWRTADAIRAAGQWPATPHWRDGCRWCRLPNCPRKLELLRRER